MEKEFYTDNFEQLLKDATKDFKMYPSRKVWHSLYNDLHPGRRWPSLAVCLLLVTAILYLGITNNNSINEALLSRNSVEKNQLAYTASMHGKEVNKLSNSDSKIDSSLTKYRQFLSAQERVKQLLSFNLDIIANNESYQKTANGTGTLTTDNTTALINNTSYSTASTNAEALTFPVEKINPVTVIDRKNNSNQELIEEAGKIAEVNALHTASSKVADANTNLNANDKAWVDDYAFYNRHNKGKWKAKASREFYITPSLGFRTISNNSNYHVATNSLVTNSSAGVYDLDVDHKAAINLEAGGVINYSISRKLRLKTGLQLNYTNYSINAYELKHPAQTTLLLLDQNSGAPFLKPYNTIYANSPALSSTTLNNKTIQISIPVGFDFKLAGRNKIQWFAGATAQPSFIATGNAYLLSSDKKFYVNDNTLLRNWNLNTAVETFISYKTNNGITINAGPQVRYQLFSTYSKQYTYAEKLYNVGLKMGITRNF